MRYQGPCIETEHHGQQQYQQYLYRRRCPRTPCMERHEYRNNQYRHATCHQRRHRQELGRRQRISRYVKYEKTQEIRAYSAHISPHDIAQLLILATGVITYY